MTKGFSNTSTKPLIIFDSGALVAKPTAKVKIAPNAAKLSGDIGSATIKVTSNNP